MKVAAECERHRKTYVLVHAKQKLAKIPTVPKFMLKITGKAVRKGNSIHKMKRLIPCLFITGNICTIRCIHKSTYYNISKIEEK